MKRLLDDYIFSDSMRYEQHQMIYLLPGEEAVILSGMLGAAILVARLVDQPEGDDRAIAVDTLEQRRDFFARYERETRVHDGGLFKNELQAFYDAHIELYDKKYKLAAFLGLNERLFDLAFSLTVDYMQFLVREEVGDYIYQRYPWEGPFAQWLYQAGFIETRRQRFLSVDWMDPDDVLDLLRYIQSDQEETAPTFVFDGLSSEQVMDGYYNWLFNAARQEAAPFPDADVQFAELRRRILDEEIHWERQAINLKALDGKAHSLFLKWMDSWRNFLTQHMQDEFPQASTAKHPAIRQVLFLDDITPVPNPNIANPYTAVRQYIADRCKYDANFRNYVEEHTRTDLCRQLSAMFGWTVDENALGKNERRKRKYPQKSYLQEEK